MTKTELDMHKEKLEESLANYVEAAEEFGLHKCEVEANVQEMLFGAELLG